MTQSIGTTVGVIDNVRCRISHLSYKHDWVDLYLYLFSYMYV